MKRRGDDQKFLASVLAIGTECDIALLTVQDPQFWEGVTPLEFGSLPRLQVEPTRIRCCCCCCLLLLLLPAAASC